MVITVWFWYPETRGRTLENMAEVFGGEHTETAGVTADKAVEVSRKMSVSAEATEKGVEDMHVEVKNADRCETTGC